jgi:hypothetical protein
MRLSHEAGLSAGARRDHPLPGGRADKRHSDESSCAAGPLVLQPATLMYMETAVSTSITQSSGGCSNG